MIALQKAQRNKSLLLKMAEPQERGQFILDLDLTFLAVFLLTFLKEMVGGWGWGVEVEGETGRRGVRG